MFVAVDLALEIDNEEILRIDLQLIIIGGAAIKAEHARDAILLESRKPGPRSATDVNYPSPRRSRAS